jgi:hypothetical protein
VLEHLEILDSMPKDVRQTMELQDTASDAADDSNGVLLQIMGWSGNVWDHFS